MTEPNASPFLATADLHAPFSCVCAEWMPLDEVAETWADFSRYATHAHALQAVGNAFLALSFEMSAHSHYTQAYHGLWKLSPTTVAQGIAEALTDLHETGQQWLCAYQWLERFANETSHDEERMTAIREVFGSIAAQQHRLWPLIARLGGNSVLSSAMAHSSSTWDTSRPHPWQSRRRRKSDEHHTTK